MTKQKKESEKTEMKAMQGYRGIGDLNFMNEAIENECAGLDFALERIKFPSGGVTSFEAPTGEEETTETTKEIECVILYSHAVNSYYRESYKGGTNPPDCGSMDGKYGVGNPGGDCKTCPLNQFGTGEGNAKACKNKRMMYLLREGELFPLMMILPPGSLRSFTKYVQTLLTKGRRPHQVVTEISLRKAKNDNSPEFSQAVFKAVRMLDAEERENIEALIPQVRAYCNRMTTERMMQVDDADNPFVDPETGEVLEPLV